MSVKVMSVIFDRYPNGGGEMLLALALADHAHDDGTSVRPSVRTLAKKTRQSERTVQYQLRKMQACGWLILVRVSSGKPGDTNEYKINSAWLTGAKSDGCNFCTGAIDDIDGCNQQHGRVQNGAETGAIAVAPKPLLKPSINLPPTPQGGDEDKIPAGWKADSRTMKPMSLYWTPDTDTLNTYLQGKAANGRPVTAADISARLDSWRENANASGKVMTDAQWTLMLIKYAMTCMTSDRAAPANRRASAPQEDPLAFTEENRPKHGPYALFKPGPKKTPMTDEGRARVEQLRRQAFGDTA